MGDSVNATKRPKGVECQRSTDGTKNPKYIDILEEDRPIGNQKFVCMSFISPERIIKQRELYLLNSYLKQWDMNKSLEKYNQFLNFLAFKYSLTYEDLCTDFSEFCTTEKNNLFGTTIEDEYKTYLDKNEKHLGESFKKEHAFQTNTRGVKIRGSYPSLEEAELRCKMLREFDPNHDVFVGPVGTWMPFDPEAYKTGRVEYLEDELNQLMHEKVKNETKAKDEFDKRIHEAKRKAIEDNIKKAKESGNKLSQTLNDDGNLVSVKNLNTVDNKFDDENVAVADIRKELFEGNNIVTSRENNDADKGLSRLPEKSRVNLERALGIDIPKALGNEKISKRKVEDNITMEIVNRDTQPAEGDDSGRKSE